MLNDLFGIQSRAGCSCAGPYGHILLDISHEVSEQYRQIIAQGYTGLKPGWVRINLHYTFTREDIEFLARSIRFVAEYGPLFLSKYEFFMYSGEWRYTGYGEEVPHLSLDSSFASQEINRADLVELRESYFRQAHQCIEELQAQGPQTFPKDEKNIEQLKYFYYTHVNRTRPQKQPCCAI